MYAVFDMDGLMFDTERVFTLAWDYAGERLGVGKAGYMTLKTLGLTKPEVNEAWKLEFGERIDITEMRRYSKEFLTDYYAHNRVPIKKGLYSLLDFLKGRGAGLAVASSSPRHEVEHHLKDTGVFEYFDALVCGDMVTRSKPEPDIFLCACELLGAPPRETYVLEDSKNGILAAHRAGCRPVMVPDLQPADDEVRALAAGIFADLDEVCEAFENGILG